METDRKQIEFGRLFERYYPVVRRFFATRGFSSEECLDLAQETFLNVFKGLDTFRADASPETWLYCIAKYVRSNALRSRFTAKRGGNFKEIAVPFASEEELFDELLEIQACLPTALDNLLLEEQKVAVRRALSSLPPQMRQVVLLRIDGGYKYREVAEVLGISIETVKTQLFHARRRLKEMLTLEDDISGLEEESEL